jgi:hypothetical protein
MIIDTSKSPRGTKIEESKYFKKDLTSFVPAPRKNINQQVSSLNEELYSTSHNIESLKKYQKDEKARTEQRQN